jgi:dTDP-4-dehydrorhamnose reductase
LKNEKGKILILGANGNIGRLLVKYFSGRAIGCYRTNETDGIQFDLLKDKISEVLPSGCFISHAIILAGITSPAKIVADPSSAWSVNVGATWKLIEDLIELKIKPIFTSSDAVLGFGKGPFNEHSKVSPETLYGQFKWAIEQKLLNSSSDHLIYRLPRIYGVTIGDGTLITQLFEQMASKREVFVSGDQVFSPLYGHDLCDAIEKSLNADLNGLYHLGGEENVCHADIASMIYAELSKYQQVDCDLVIKKINDFVSYETRPLDISMNSDKIRQKLDLSPINLSEAVSRVVHAGTQGH